MGEFDDQLSFMEHNSAENPGDCGFTVCLWQKPNSQITDFRQLFNFGYANSYESLSFDYYDAGYDQY